MKEVIVVFGTRPEAIKVAPVVAALRDLRIQPLVYCTGQHTTLLEGSPAETDLQDATMLQLPGQADVVAWVQGAVRVLKKVLRRHDPSIICVQGDTATAYATAIAVQRLRQEAPRQTVPHQLAHIEAGVRSGDETDPWPEERFRKEIDAIADYHFCPTEHCVPNLPFVRRETPDRLTLPDGMVASTFVTGNSGVSALHRYGGRLRPIPYGNRSLLITLHRRELLRDPHLGEIVQQIMTEIQGLRANWRVCWPLHPSLQHVLAQEQIDLHAIPGVLRVVPPLPYRAMIQTLRRCSGVLTDSGGLTEDATTLGIPTVILRNHHDRPEACQTGSALLVGRSVEGVTAGFRALQGPWPRIPNPVFGTPDSAQRIAKILAGLAQ